MLPVLALDYIVDLLSMPAHGRLANIIENSSNSESSDDDEEDLSRDATLEDGAPQRSGKLLVLRKILPLWHQQVSSCTKFLRSSVSVTSNYTLRGYLALLGCSDPSTQWARRVMLDAHFRVGTNAGSGLRKHVWGRVNDENCS